MQQKMDLQEIIKRSEKIVPIVWHDFKRVYGKRNNSEQSINEDYRFTTFNYAEIPEPVGDELAILADVKMIHKFDYGYRLTVTVADIINQIPKHLLEKTIAFEMVYNDQSKMQRKIFQKEFDAGFYVSVVRLYQANCDSSNSASLKGLYPEELAPVPIGMTTEEFQKVKEVSEYMRQKGLY